ncbi:MAG: MarR family transcriptional regulator [Tepidibacter sp.]|jgi:DNA-binding MarR family transcriptional regulator|uniref:MarR family winged helix-turn-helix transcriptional regulator n=1 Tax=Tepidibacter sp. TaxID=2529387 RepID=UPI0025E57CB3|nr:MarR family transcriptional regulator [Tepidibacter sp.]MCT4507341.1 MarR family transcriptional regulator [Tepidibacter sp.]
MKLEVNLLEMEEYIHKVYKKYIEKIMTKQEFSRFSINHMYYLEYIYTLNNPTFSQLAQALNVSKPSVTAMIKRLTDQGYVKKMKSEHDKREFHIYLTDRGKEILNAELEVYKHFTEKISKHLSEEEVELFSKLVSKIIVSIKKENTMEVIECN